MIRVAVIGYGNIGFHAIKAILAEPDMELVGVVRRSPDPIEEFPNVKFASDIKELDAQVAILAVPSRMVPETAEKYLSMGINTVDSFDIHGDINDLRSKLHHVAIANNSVAIIASGWDPGTDSIIRTVLEACTPRGITYTNFGPGMSMGHSVAAKAILGVKKALSMTIPIGTGIHRRMVYIELENGADIKEVEAAIKTDTYFSHDDTHVIQVDDVDKFLDMGHGVNLVRKGVSGGTHNQLFEFNMKINNPALTAQIMVSAARATCRQKSGAYTTIEIPPIDFLCGEREENIKRLV